MTMNGWMETSAVVLLALTDNGFGFTQVNSHFKKQDKTVIVLLAFYFNICVIRQTAITG